jgi:hypothetical protein
MADKQGQAKVAVQRRRSKESNLLRLSPSLETIEAIKNAIPKLDPIDFRALIAEAKQKAGPESIDQSVSLVLADRLKAQAEFLLVQLGLDPSDGNVWRTAFMRLASAHYGMGNLVFSPKRTNTNAKQWNHDFELLTVMRDLKAKGIEGSLAFEEIAKDPELRNLFPYSTRSQIKGKDKLAKTLSERWRKLQLGAGHSLLNAISGDAPLGAGAFEFKLWFLDFLQNLPPDPAKDETT